MMEFELKDCFALGCSENDALTKGNICTFFLSLKDGRTFLVQVSRFTMFIKWIDQYQFIIQVSNRNDVSSWVRVINTTASLSHCHTNHTEKAKITLIKEIDFLSHQIVKVTVILLTVTCSNIQSNFKILRLSYDRTLIMKKNQAQKFPTKIQNCWDKISNFMP